MKTLTFCLALIVMSCTLAFGQTYKVLWNFAGAPNDGAGPVSNLISDSSGNFYGTTQLGGNSTSTNCSDGGCGTVFELSPNPDGGWTESVLYNFCTNFQNNLCLDGKYPTAGLALDSAGNLYGTTYAGGGCLGEPGCGTVFELSPLKAPGGSWFETVLYSFCANKVNNQCLDGLEPNSQLIFDEQGSLYGTTFGGGNGAWYGGIVFELSPNAGTWTEKILYNFCTNGTDLHCPDGTGPLAGVVFDHVGNLYGTTQAGGTPRGGGAGTVYKLTPGSGGWTQSVLLAFNPAQGFAYPEGGVSFDSAGNLYSTAFGGGSKGLGGVFRFNPKTGIERGVSFNGNDGAGPAAGLLVQRGAVYGTTESGFSQSNGGVFKIGSTGKETILYAFCQQPNCTDGARPYGSLITKSGNLYGTARNGGANGFGVVFEITP